MAASPLSLPSWLKFQEFKMRTIDTIDVSMLEGRRTETASFGTSYWAVNEARSEPLEVYEVDDLEAFFHQAQRGGATFICPDQFRLRPRFYGSVPLTGVKAVGGATFNGTAVLQTITNSKQVTVSGLPNGFVLTRGDLVELNNSTLIRSLHRIITSVTSGAGGTAVVNFEPPLNTTVFTTASVVQFEKPACIMALKEWDLPRAYEARVATFSATEVFFS